MTAASDIIRGLIDYGYTLVFCDDSEIAGSPHKNLAADLRILCAIVMSSKDYALIKNQMEDKLKTFAHNLIEFHATEIVNPKKTSPWSHLSQERRIDAFKFLQTVLAQKIRKLYYAFVTEGQFRELRKEAQKQASVEVAHRQGLKRVFLRCLFERLASTHERIVVLMDHDKPQDCPTIEKWPEGSFLVGGGPISAGSALIQGLQLADMAAFCITRYLRKRPGIVKGTASTFDIMAAETVAGLEGRVECLLNE